VHDGRRNVNGPRFWISYEVLTHLYQSSVSGRGSERVSPKEQKNAIGEALNPSEVLWAEVAKQSEGIGGLRLNRSDVSGGGKKDAHLDPDYGPSLAPDTQR
jgi:hypothetical protein